MHTDEHIAEVLAVDQQVFAIGVQMSRWWPPVFLQPLGVGGQPLVLFHRHPVGNVQLRAGVLGLGIVDHRFHQPHGGVGQVLDVVTVVLQRLHHFVDRGKHIQVGGGANVALVGREAENGDGNALVYFGFSAQVA